MRILIIEDFLENYKDYIEGHNKIISIAGGSRCGKTYFSNKLSEKIDYQIISLDDYIIPRKITKNSNWDLPECWNLNLLKSNLNKFLDCKEFKKPIYDFKTGNNNNYEIIYPHKNIILEGLYALHDDVIKFAELKIFIDINEQERLRRALENDVIERGTKTKKKILKRWNETIQPAYLEFVEPQRDMADIILV